MQKKITTKTLQKLNQEGRHGSFVLKKKKERENKGVSSLEKLKFQRKTISIFFKLGKNFSFKSILSSLITNAKVS